MESSDKATGRPVKLIDYDAGTGKFFVQNEAVETLRGLKGPVGVVAVCGRARTGKSYILNQLLKLSGGFRVAATHKPCTKGLWIWSAPVTLQTSSNQNYHLILLDCEGIDAYNQTAHDSVAIFALAVLLSSFFVYNQMGGIDEPALDRLSLVTELSKHIRVRASSSKDSSNDMELSEFSPSFLWLLRDFYFDLEDNGSKITPNDYLETALEPTAGTSASVQSKNQIRHSIRNLFPDRNCFTLVRPVTDEQELQHLDTVPSSSLRPEFRQGIERLTKLIFSKSRPKRISGHAVTGPILAGLAEAYVNAINEGAVPTITTAWQGVSEAECQRAAKLGLDAYAQEFSEDVEPEDMALAEEHQRAIAAATATYKQTAVGDEDMKENFHERMLDDLNKRFSGFRKQRLAEAAALNDKLVYKLASKLDVLGRVTETWPEMEAHINEAIKEYREAAVGPTKWERLAEFTQNQYAAATLTFLEKFENRGREELLRMRLQAEEAVRQARTAESRAEAAERRWDAATRIAEITEPPKASSRSGWGCCLNPSAF